MNIEIHTLAHQEAKLVPYVMRHYEGWAKVIAYTGHSTDGTEDMLRKMGAETVFLNTNNESNDGIFQRMKNTCWKGSKADWVIVSDFDELIYAKNIIKILEESTATLIRPKKAEMYSLEFPEGNGKITDLVKTGVLGSAKFHIFRPSQIREMNFDPGCHNCRPEGNVIIADYAHDVPGHIETEDPIMCLHYRNLGKKYIRERQAYTASRLSALNKKMGWGLFVLCPWSDTEKFFDDNMKYVKNVI